MPSMKFLKFTHLKISCLPVVFKIFSLWPLKTPNDTWSPLQNNRDRPLNKGYTHAIKHEISKREASWDAVFTSRFQGSYCFTPGCLNWSLTSTCEVPDPSKYPVLRYLVNKVFTVWSLVTSNHLWPWTKLSKSNKIISITYSIRGTHMPGLRFLNIILFLRFGVSKESATYTHTHKGHHTIDSFFLWQGIKTTLICLII